MTLANTMSDELLFQCRLSDWNGEPTYCRWCNKPLTGRQQRWCSTTCANDAAANHWWNAARHRARRREGNACVRCGTPEYALVDGRPVVVQLEVHHRDERADGRHGECSCVHHVDGLETLCRPCHLAEHHGAKPAKGEQLAIGDAA